MCIVKALTMTVLPLRLFPLWISGKEKNTHFGSIRFRLWEPNHPCAFQNCHDRNRLSQHNQNRQTGLPVDGYVWLLHNYWDVAVLLQISG